MRSHLFMTVGLAGTLGWKALAASYYLDERGDDRAAGISPESAWASLERINSVDLKPGDRILLKGGNSFQGELRFDEFDSGSPKAPVTVQSIGEGRARLIANQGNGIHLKNGANIVIRDLKIIGNGPASNRGYGVLCENTLTNGMCDGLAIQNLEITGFGKHGIMVTGAPYGFTNVAIRNCTMFNNLKGGMEVAGRLAWDAKHYAHGNVVVSDCSAFENPGDPNYTANHSGSGIVLYQVDGGRIERCKAWGNGASCPAKGGGPVGIWTCASRRVVIQYCESFRNLSKGLDGGGFDIDGGSEECVLQYNYSHDNRGPGLMVYTYEYASHRDRDNVVRFNISVNDAQNTNRYGGLWIRADGRSMAGLKVYNNTIFTRGAPAAWIHGAGVEVELQNNIVWTTMNSLALQVDDATNQIVLHNNLYWRSGSPFLARWNGDEIRSLEEFQKEDGRERIKGKKVGLFIDPMIPLEQAISIKSPISDFSVLAAFRPANAAARTGGVLLSEAHSNERPPRDLNGVEFAPLPFGAVAAPPSAR